ncbi:MAG: hypothetical protein QNJ55_24215 [Xenococcus sp. MO_188.B8]|nr:hypothetical protein [Xenococcus sp. MO_188.B8]
MRSLLGFCDRQLIIPQFSNAENLLSRDNLTPEEDALWELLVKLIEDFADKHYVN